jgi:hypothetical protein
MALGTASVSNAGSVDSVAATVGKRCRRHHVRRLVDVDERNANASTGGSGTLIHAVHLDDAVVLIVDVANKCVDERRNDRAADGSEPARSSARNSTLVLVDDPVVQFVVDFGNGFVGCSDDSVAGAVVLFVDVINDDDTAIRIVYVGSRCNDVDDAVATYGGAVASANVAIRIIVAGSAAADFHRPQTVRTV